MQSFLRPLLFRAERARDMFLVLSLPLAPSLQRLRVGSETNTPLCMAPVIKCDG